MTREVQVVKTIVFCSEKGGVGKTSLASELYASLARTGEDAALISMDPQYGDGMRRTTENKGDPDVAVVDMPGYLDQRMLGTLKHADAVIVLTRATALNLEPLVRTLRVVREATTAPICLVVNAVAARRVSMRQFSDWLGSWDGRGEAYVTEIPESAAFATAEMANTSVVDLLRRRPSSYAAGVAPAVMGLVNWCRAQAGLAPEE